MSFVSLSIPSRLTVWWQAIRPRTLTMAVVPVAVGAAVAFGEAGRFAFVPVAAALIGALAIQIGTNLFNDASDGETGLDRPGRLGPPRVTAEGWATAAQVKAAAKLAFAVATAAGVVAIGYGGVTILAVGVASLVAGWAYSRGPAPISQGPFGEVFVLIFFGIVAVCGTHWLVAREPSLLALVAGIVVGLPAAAVLLVNNHRDRDCDAANGRRTLAIRLGMAATRRLYAALLAATVALPIGFGLAAGRPWLVIAVAAVPCAVPLIRGMAHEPIGQGLNLLLGRTAVFQAVVAALFVAGVLV